MFGTRGVSTYNDSDRRSSDVLMNQRVLHWSSALAKRVALVACVSKKQPSPMPAQSLYSSDWFRKASAYARRTADDWYILSAKHALLAPHKVIAPYDETLKRMRAPAKETWSKGVLRELVTVLQPGDRVVILAGKDYREYLLSRIRAMGCVVEIPMKGLRIVSRGIASMTTSPE